MASIITDGSPSSVAKKVGLMKRLSDPVKEIDFNKQFILLHSIIDLIFLYKGVLDMNHATDPLVKFVNFIKEKELDVDPFLDLVAYYVMDYFPKVVLYISKRDIEGF
ncbi:hypothetical protein RF11_00603 [Thelohanellus kitauei]|uniref:Uncharacterized protein n=1 Tax=Thelohanellus kitauei TaxID=669202 RepID=A0A0C2MGN4_THEKT|nr:hypothetical protein RF11_00603 [Thelohanellus kitauei]